MKHESHWADADALSKKIRKRVVQAAQAADVLPQVARATRRILNIQTCIAQARSALHLPGLAKIRSQLGLRPNYRTFAYASAAARLNAAERCERQCGFWPNKRLSSRAVMITRV